MDRPEVLRLLQAAKLDPVEFFGADVEGKYRELARILHPDLGGDKDDFQLLAELRDAARATPQLLTSPQRTYSKRSVLGRGDLCDVSYAVCDGNYADKRNDERCEYVIKTPYVELPAANNLLAKEREVLEQFHERAKGTTYEKYLPVPVESFVIDKKRINVCEWRSGLFSAQKIHEHHASLRGEHLAWMYKRILSILGFIHSLGWTHGAIVPQHVLFSASDHGLHLVDWIHCETIGKPIKTVPAINKAWYPKDKIASPAFDIWMAAKTMIYLAGGDPITNDMPRSVPPLMRQFFLSSVLNPARLNSEEAWQLSDQFTDLLENLYGPPRFVTLEM